MSIYKNRIKTSIEKCENVRSMALRREITIFDLMEQTTQITRDIIIDEFRRYAPQKGIAIFVYGSASRNEMVTHSDVDILFIETKPCNKAIKNILRTLIYGFGKADKFETQKQNRIEKYVKHSLTDRDKILFAQFIVGDTSILQWMDNLKSRENIIGSNTEHIFFQQYHLRNYYYINSNKKEIHNVKYQNGGTYDLLIYNMFDNAMSMYRGNDWMREPESNRPKIESTLKNMNKNGILSDSEYDDVKVAAEFMILLRNEILHVNKNTKYDHIAYINKEMEHRVFESASDFFKSYNINTPEELHKVYQKHRKIIFNIKLNLFKILLDEEEKRKGSIWRRTFNLAEKGELNTPSGDPIIDIAMIWGLNRLGDKNRFNNITKQLNWNWGTCSSIACSNLASPELLENIRSYCQPIPELRYVLRIIARNFNTNKETLSKIAEDPNLGFWSEVAKKRLESGLDAAINIP